MIASAVREMASTRYRKSWLSQMPPATPSSDRGTDPPGEGLQHGSLGLVDAAHVIADCDDDAARQFLGEGHQRLLLTLVNRRHPHPAPLGPDYRDLPGQPRALRRLNQEGQCPWTTAILHGMGHQVRQAAGREFIG